MNIKYHKYHALKNDFIVIEKDNFRISYDKLSELALSICNRRSGVGADGIAVISKSKEADIKLDIFNSDGSWAEKSGNGMRIAGLLSQRLLGYPEKNSTRLDGTLDRYGLKRLDLSQFDEKELWRAMKSDKKAHNASPRFTLLDSERKPALLHHVSEKEFSHALAAI